MSRVARPAGRRLRRRLARALVVAQAAVIGPAWADGLPGTPSAMPVAPATFHPSGGPPPVADLEAALAPVPEAHARWRAGDARGALDALLAAIEADDPAQPGRLALVAELALRAGDGARAQSALEHLVLLQPQAAGAWLDLVVASLQAGDLPAARSYLAYVEATFPRAAGLEPVLRALHGQLAAAIAAEDTSGGGSAGTGSAGAGSPRANLPGERAPAAASVRSGREPASWIDRWSGRWQLAAGHDSNANGGLLARDLTLAQGDERIVLALDPALRPRGSAFVELGGQARTELPLGDGDTLLGVELLGRVRRHAQSAGLDTAEASVGATLARALPWAVLRLSAHADHLRLDGRALVDVARVGIGLDRPAGGRCRIGAGLELEARRFPGRGTLDGDIAWLQAAAACKAGGWEGALRLRAGEDRPLGDRAGGATDRLELLGQLRLARPGGWSPALLAGWGAARDAQPYSAMLPGEPVRRQERHFARLSASRPAAAGTELVVGIERQYLSSNVALFRQSGTVVSVGLRSGGGS